MLYEIVLMNDEVVFMNERIISQIKLDKTTGFYTLIHFNGSKVQIKSFKLYK